MARNLFFRLLRRLRISNFRYVAFGNRVRFLCDARKSKLYVYNGKDNVVDIDDSVEAFDIKIIVKGNHNHLVVKKGAYIRGVIELIGDGNRITLGERTVIGGGLIMAHHGTTITIGNDCLISGAVNIRTSDSHSILDADGNRLNPEKDIVIRDRVWFGKDVTVMKGCVIGNDVVVGTLSLVCKEVPSNTVVAGIPARVIRENTTWCWEVV